MSFEPNATARPLAWLPFAGAVTATVASLTTGFTGLPFTRRDRTRDTTIQSFS